MYKKTPKTYFPKTPAYCIELCICLSAYRTPFNCSCATFLSESQTFVLLATFQGRGNWACIVKVRLHEICFQSSCIIFHIVTSLYHMVNVTVPHLAIQRRKVCMGKVTLCGEPNLEANSRAKYFSLHPECLS
uniref:Uncharacterized protein n=1 Tax=Chelydra serpentina TaxID=8475 RepID=A0A8C3TIZ7_CHESE